MEIENQIDYFFHRLQCPDKYLIPCNSSNYFISYSDSNSRTEQVQHKLNIISQKDLKIKHSITSTKVSKQVRMSDTVLCILFENGKARVYHTNHFEKEKLILCFLTPLPNFNSFEIQKMACNNKGGVVCLTNTNFVVFYDVVDSARQLKVQSLIELKFSDQPIDMIYDGDYVLVFSLTTLHMCMRNGIINICCYDKFIFATDGTNLYYLDVPNHLFKEIYISFEADISNISIFKWGNRQNICVFVLFDDIMFVLEFDENLNYPVISTTYFDSFINPIDNIYFISHGFVIHSNTTFYIVNDLKNSYNSQYITLQSYDTKLDKLIDLTDNKLRTIVTSPPVQTPFIGTTYNSNSQRISGNQLCRMQVPSKIEFKEIDIKSNINTAEDIQYNVYCIIGTGGYEIQSIKTLFNGNTNEYVMIAFDSKSHIYQTHIRKNLEQYQPISLTEKQGQFNDKTEVIIEPGVAYFLTNQKSNNLTTNPNFTQIYRFDKDGIIEEMKNENKKKFIYVEGGTICIPFQNELVKLSADNSKFWLEMFGEGKIIYQSPSNKLLDIRTFPFSIMIFFQDKFWYITSDKKYYSFIIDYDDIKDICGTRSGFIFLSNNCFYELHNDDLTHLKKINLSGYGLGNGYFRCCYCDNNDNLWIGGSHGRITLVNTKSN
ncbi:CNH domain-containing protein [Entamoeba marina]